MDMDISMDIHAKSVHMDMDGKFHIHDNPELLVTERLPSLGLVPWNNLPEFITDCSSSCTVKQCLNTYLIQSVVLSTQHPSSWLCKAP